MALFDFLKKKEEAEKAKGQKPAVVKTGKASVAKTSKTTKKVEKSPEGASDTVKEEKKPVSKTSKGMKFSYIVVKEPHISEKSSILAEENKYVFKVEARSNKPEIKKSVEGIYGVNVLSVKIIKAPAKKRRLGKTEGFKKGFKKAVVTIKEGQKIEIL